LRRRAAMSDRNIQTRATLRLLAIVVVLLILVSPGALLIFIMYERPSPVPLIAMWPVALAFVAWFIWRARQRDVMDKVGEV